MLVVAGEAGIGKTTLLDYAAERAEDVDVVRMAGTEAERDLAFGALALVLAPRDDDLAHIPPPQARALRIALAMESGGPVDRFAVGAATLSLLSRRAEAGPIALLLDDAHHLDRPSAQALAFAARRLVADPILFLAAVRTDEPSPLRTAGLPTLTISGLDPAGTAALLTRAQTEHGDWAVPDRSTWVHQATGGNPLAILELSRDPERAFAAASYPAGAPLPVPAALAESFGRRADAAGPMTATLLALAEVAARDLRVVVRAARTLGFDAVPALSAAEVAGLVRTSAERIVTTHPLVGSSAYAGLPAERRRALHGAVEAALPATDLTRRAWHRAAATLGPDDGAADAVAAVGDESRHRGAYAVAASAYARAAQLTLDDRARAGRLVDAADAAWSAGDGAWANGLLDEGLGLGPRPQVRGRALELKGAIAARSGSMDEAWSVLVAAAREVAGSDPRRAVHLVAEAVDVAFYLADGDVARQTEELAASLVGGLVEADGVTEHSAAGVGHVAIGMARILDGRDGAADLRRGMALLGGADARPSADFDSSWLLFGALFLREEGSTRRIVRAVEEARSTTSVGALPHLLFHLARDEATTDRWARAQSDYSEAIALADELGQTTEAAMSLSGLAWVEARQGKEDECRAHAARAVELAGSRHVTVAEIWARHALGELDLAAGRVEAAVATFTRLEEFLAASGTRDVDVSPAPELVEALLRAGDEQTARSLATRHRDRAETKGQPWSLARAGRSALLLAPDDTLDDIFATTLELHHRTPDAFETARTLLTYGSRLRRARRRVDARSPLEGAYATFELLGARPWAQTAADELEATGVIVARHGIGGLDLLTPRERQIVTLLVEGRTTREAAGALFVSPKTVEYHLRHVYTKLGITSRKELATLVASP